MPDALEDLLFLFLTWLATDLPCRERNSRGSASPSVCLRGPSICERDFWSVLDVRLSLLVPWTCSGGDKVRGVARDTRHGQK